MKAKTPSIHTFVALWLAMICMGSLPAVCQKSGSPGAVAAPKPVDATKPTDATKPEYTTPEEPKAAIVFEDTHHKFNRITEGERVTATYKFTNKGSKPYTIKDVKPGCGCTTGDFTKAPIAAGGTGFVKLGFDSSGKPGLVRKSASVIGEDGSAIALTFEVEVTPATKDKTDPSPSAPSTPKSTKASN